MKHQLTPDKWVENYADKMYNFAVWRIQDTEQCEDMVQETFLSALKSKHTFKGESSEQTWLFAILKNKIIDSLRKKAISRTGTLQNSVLKEDIYDLCFDSTDDYTNGHWKKAEAPTQWAKSTHEDLENQEFYRILYACMSKLPSQQADVIGQKFLEEIESETICKVLNISSSNFWVIMHRAKLYLRKCLEQNWFNQDDNAKKYQKSHL